MADGELEPRRRPIRSIPSVLPAAAAVDRAAEVLLSAIESRRSWPAAAWSKPTPSRELVASGRAARRVPCFREPGTTHGRLAFSDRSSALWPRACRFGRRRSATRWRNSTCCWSSAWICCGNMSITSRPAPFPSDIRLVHLDEDPYQLGKNYPLAAAVWGSTRGGLTAIDAALAERMTAEQIARGPRSNRAHWPLPSTMPASNCGATRLAQRCATAADAGGLHGVPGRNSAGQRGRDRRSRHDDQHDVRAAGSPAKHDAATSAIAAGPWAGDWAARWA